MNAKGLGLVLFAALTSSPVLLPGQEPRAGAGDLPPAVQRALNETSKGEPIKTINRRVIDGRTVYDIELERDNAINPRFRITEDGVVLAGAQPPARDGLNPHMTPYDGGVGPVPVLDTTTSVDTLPAAVRATVKREAAGRVIADIDRESWKGRVVYEVEFKESGRNPQIHVAEDGTVVRGEQTRGGQVGAAIRGLFMGTQLEDTPPAVQETIRREARDKSIRDIDVKTRAGQRVYEVEIDDARTVFQLHVAEDGRILYDPRPEASSAKRG